MKTIIISLVMMVSCSLSAYSQDVIVLKDGSTILSKVVEIGVSEIKYKKWDNLEGPNYSILRTDVQAVNFENGGKEVFSNQLDSLSLVKQLDVNTRERYLRNANIWQKVGGIYFWVNVIAGSTLAIIHDDYGADFAYIMGGALIDGIIGLYIFNEIGRSWEKKANTFQTTSSLLRKDIKLGNTNITAGVDIIHNKVTQEKNFGFVVGLNL